jgi:hypothetical protein
MRVRSQIFVGGRAVLEYLGYGLFAVCMFGCLVYVMSSLETEDAANGKPFEPKQ